jgi:hypothetical protein
MLAAFLVLPVCDTSILVSHTGEETKPPPSPAVAITGGTGFYAEARGWMDLYDRKAMGRAPTQEYDFIIYMYCLTYMYCLLPGDE